MDLTARLLRLAARRPHVLVVAVPGQAAVRLRVEAALARRGWPLAASPADADLLVVAGVPGPGLRPVAERIWRQVPAPRALVEIADAHGVDTPLDAGAALLADPGHQRATAPGRGAVPPPADGEHGQGDHEPATADAGHPEHDGHAHESHPHSGHAERGHGEHEPATTDGGHSDHGPDGHPHEHGGHEHSGDEHCGDEHAGHESGGREHGEHGEHGGHGGGHHMHHGGVVAGLPMADLGEDRDGLALDRLHVPLGPVLPDWPAGLVLHLTLQGDVVQEATAEVLDAAADPPGSDLVRELDALARLLGVAGWDSAASRARRLRDELVAGGPVADIACRVNALVGRVRRARTLRWQVRRLPAGPTDVAALLDQRLAAVEAALLGRDVPSRPSVAELAELVVGAELAAARLVVAALDPAPVPAVATHV